MKYIEIIKSPRWQMALTAAVLHGLQIFNQTGSLRQSIILPAIELLSATILIGTVDKFSEAKMASATNTTVSMPKTVATVTAKTTTKKK